MTRREVEPPAEAIAHLATHPPFAALPDACLKAITEQGTWATYDTGDAVFRLNEVGQHLCYLVQGRLEARIPGTFGEPATVVRIGPGELAGELTVLSPGQPRSADVYAARSSLVLELTREVAVALSLRFPELSLALARFIADRLRQNNLRAGQAAHPPAVIVLVGGSHHVPLEQLTHDLAAELPGESHVVNEARGEALLEAEAVDARHLGLWADAREREGDRVLFQVSDPRGAWARACFGLADLVLVLVNPDSYASAGLPEALSRAGVGDRAEVVFVQKPSVKTPTGSAAWLARLGVVARHHVRVRRGRPPTGEARADLLRLVRRLTHSSVSLALGGGAARGVSHLGVLRAFDALRIPIDLACGTSMGAIFAAEVALGKPVDEIARDIEAFFGNYSWFRPHPIPSVSFASGAPIQRLCDTLYGDVEIADVWTSFFAVASNLSTASIEVMDRGTVNHAVLASGSVPGLFPPVVHGEHLLVDGVVTNNLPADLAWRRMPGHTIAVNVIPRDDPMFAGEHLSTSRGRVMVERLNPFARSKAPTVADIGLRSLFLATVRHAEEIRRSVDVFIEPDVARFGLLFEVSRREEIIEEGYRAAMDSLTRWLDGGPALPGR